MLMVSSDMTLDKLLLLLLTLFYTLTGLVPSCHSALNIAINKTYTVSPAQNYSLSAPATDKTSLTDGKYTTGHFWTRQTTLGWQDRNPVEILIDLGTVSNIDGISFSTARGNHAGVNYPAQIAVFAGSDRNRLIYVGDIAKDPDNVPGTYKTKKFALTNISAKGRFVLLLIVPNGKYLFCDEIEVIEGTHNRGAVGTLSIEGARNFQSHLRRLSVEKEFLISLAEKVKSTATHKLEQGAPLSEMDKKLTTLSSLEDVAAIEADVLMLRAKLLHEQFPGKNFLLAAVNPWASLSPTSLPGDTLPQNISIIIPQGGYDYAAFVVTNLTADAQPVTIQSEKLPREAPELDYYHVPFVKSAAMELVADPLIPIKGSFTLRSGESRMVILAARGQRSGTWRGTLKVISSAWVTTVPMEIQVSRFAIPNKLALNSVNWSYLDFKPIRERKTAAIEDLLSHHTNVFVVPPRYIPFSDRSSVIELVRLEKYLSLHKGASKILFFLEFRDEKAVSASGGNFFMSEEWKKWFKKLYGKLVISAENTGFSENQVYVYPFDEVGGREIDRFITLISWARAEIPSMQFYATLDKKEALKVMPYLDIAQIIDRRDLPIDDMRSKKELWLYGTAENTKSLSPYSYYRLMPWKTFALGFTGAGFWNYADTGWGENPGSAWDDFDGSRPDFAVIYEGENGTIISSRRWEAWRMGVEDYELLTMYAKAKGDKAAKALAKTVLDDPRDVGKADEVRRRILRELSQ